MILVSGCLVGLACRYDGRQASSPEALDLIAGHDWAAICPEQMGGLPTPRPPARIIGGDGAAVLNGRARLINSQGEDVTEAFVRGAYCLLNLARRWSPEKILLKDRSPSCGLNPGLDKAGRPRGRGVAAHLLTVSGFSVMEIQSKSSSPAPPPSAK